MPDKVELIAYADRLGGDLAGLKAILDGPLQGLFGGLHILLFFRTCDGADAGFDPADHTEVDSRLGSWNDGDGAGGGIRRDGGRHHPPCLGVGLMAGRNDVEQLERSRVGHDISRNYYTSEEIAEAVQRPAVEALFRLIRFRNNHPAFDGEFSLSGGGTQLVTTWTLGEEIAELSADLVSGTATVRWTSDGTTHQAALDAWA